MPRLAMLLLAALLAGCAGPGGPAPTMPAEVSPPPATTTPPPSGPPTTTATPPESGPLVGLALVAEGFDAPVLVTHAGDGSGRLFVVEQPGRIVVLRPEGDGFRRVDRAFLDVRELVASGGERGLLGLAFEPDYASSRRFYVHYTDLAGDSVLARYHASDDPDVADASGAEVLLTVEQPYANHNGGHLAFGPDGFLYWALGDGGSGGDPHGNGQDPGALLGSLLRLDVSGEGGYGWPADNPYAGGGGRAEVWAKGLRNPWRFSFDRATGDLYVGDVGQGEWEEIDFLPAGSPGGANFGWNVYEGAHRYELGAQPFSPVTNPVAEYDHGQGECAVTGGYVHRGASAPRLDGIYFFADYCNSHLFALHRVGDEWRSARVLATGLNVSSFGEDEEGDVYLVHHGGSIYRLVDAGGAWPAGFT